MSGVLSSCDTLATKSRRTVSSRRSGVRSNSASTAPPDASGRAVSVTVRPPSVQLESIDRLAGDRGRDGRAERAFAGQLVGREGDLVAHAEQPPRLGVDAHDLLARVERDRRLR